MAVTYGIFDGVSCNDTVLAVAVMDRIDYARYYRDNIDDYLDYLVTLEEVLESVKESRDAPYREVRFSFDRELYEAWLAEQPHWKDSPEARGAWALNTALDSENAQDLTVLEKLTLIYLMRCSQMKDGQVFPSYSAVAKSCCMSRRQAIRCVESLFDRKGILDERSTAGRKRSKPYQCLLHNAGPAEKRGGTGAGVEKQ